MKLPIVNEDLVIPILTVKILKSNHLIIFAYNSFQGSIYYEARIQTRTRDTTRTLTHRHS